MELNNYQTKRVVSKSLSYLGNPWTKNEFTCVDFVRNVYREVDIDIPLLGIDFPPKDLNISMEQIGNPPAGHLMFLKNRKTLRQDRAWTHVVIVISQNYCIHCSLLLGGTVMISSFEEIFARYDFVESTHSV